MPVRVIHDDDAIWLHFLNSAPSAFYSAKTIDHDDIEATVWELIDGRDVVIKEVLAFISQLRLRAVFAAFGAWDEAHICGGALSRYLICPFALGLDGGYREATVREPDS